MQNQWTTFKEKLLELASMFEAGMTIEIQDDTVTIQGYDFTSDGEGYTARGYEMPITIDVSNGGDRESPDFDVEGTLSLIAHDNSGRPGA